MTEHEQQYKSINNDELMETIRKYPAIYEKSTNDYHDNRKKKNAWNAVEKLLGTEPGAAQKRYSTIRTRFSKYLKDLKLPSGSGNEIVLKPQFEGLRWLISHIRPRPTKSNYASHAVCPVSDDDDDNDYNQENNVSNRPDSNEPRPSSAAEGITASSPEDAMPMRQLSTKQPRPCSSMENATPQISKRRKITPALPISPQKVDLSL